MESKLITSTYLNTVGTLVLAFLAASVLASSMPSAMAYSGMATYIEYDPEDQDVNWEWGSQKCPALDTNYLLEYRQRHRWTEFCGDCGPYTGSCGCHKCLEVTNSAASASVTVRIIDICDSDDGLVLWMDKDMFDDLDTGGLGAALGGSGTAQIQVNYQITDCEDD